MEENGSQKFEDAADLALAPEGAPKTPEIVPMLAAKSVSSEKEAPELALDPKSTNGNGVKPDMEELPITSSKRRLSDDNGLAGDQVTKRHKSEEVASSATELNEEEEDELLKEISKVTDDDKAVGGGDEKIGQPNGKRMDELAQDDDLLKRISEIETPPRPKTSVVPDDTAPSDTDDLLERLEASAEDDDAALSKELETEPQKVVEEVPDQKVESQTDESPAIAAVEVPDAVPAEPDIQKEIITETEIEAPKDEEVKVVDLPPTDNEEVEASLLDTAVDAIVPIESESIDEISAEIETACHEADALLALPIPEKAKPTAPVESKAEEMQPEKSILDEPESIEATLEAMEASEVVVKTVVESSEQNLETVETVEKTETSENGAVPPVAAETIDDLTSLLEDGEENEPNVSEETSTNGDVEPTQSDEKVKTSGEVSPMPSLEVSLDNSGFGAEKADMELSDSNEKKSDEVTSTEAGAVVNAAPAKDDNDVTDTEMPSKDNNDVAIPPKDDNAVVTLTKEDNDVAMLLEGDKDVAMLPKDDKEIAILPKEDKEVLTLPKEDKDAALSPKDDTEVTETAMPPKNDNGVTDVAMSLKKDNVITDTMSSSKDDDDAATPTIPEETQEKSNEVKQPEVVVVEPETSISLATTAEEFDGKQNEATAAAETKPEIPDVLVLAKTISSEDDTEPMEVDDELPPVESGPNSMDTSEVDIRPTDKSFDECSSTTHNEQALNNTPKAPDMLLQAQVTARLDELDSATPTSNNVSTSNISVFNSTPILPKSKPFVISTENVSKIDESSSELESRGVPDVKGEEVKPKMIEEVDGSNVTSNTDSEVAKSTDLSEVEEKTESETDSKNMSTVAKCTSSSSSGTCSRFLDTCRQININGIDSTMDDSGDDVRGAKSVATNLEQLTIKSSQQTLSNGRESKEESNAVSSNETVSPLHADETPSYEINVWYEDQGIKTLSIEKVEGHLGQVHSLSSDGVSSRNFSSSNGSVSSFGPFTLPGPRHSNVSSTNSSSTDNNFVVPSLPKRMRHTVKGTVALYDYMIEYFTKCRYAIEDPNNESGASTIKLSDVTPQKRKSVDRRVAELRAGSKKRSLSPSRSESEDEEKLRAKQVKKSPVAVKSIAQPSTPTIAVVPDDLDPEDLEKIGQCCLARWTDRKYYAGRIEQIRPTDKKIVVRFEDGATKALNPDLVIVGREDFLPLMDQAVHALTSDDNYEPGLVTNMMRDENEQVVYTVLIVSGEIMVSPSNLYLTDEQAKMIQAAQKKVLAESRGDVDSTNMLSPIVGRRPVRRNSKSETPDMSQPGESATKAGRSLRNRRAADKTVNESPEAGYSGGVQADGKRGRRSNKRNAIQPSRSESSDISENFEDSAPNSPESGLEAIDGVQPELQKVPKETELIKMNVIAEYLGNDKNKSLEDILGPIPSSKTLFRNKHFILTCTIPIKGSKEASPTSDSTDDKEPADSMTNRLKKFATLPFVKEHLKNQIEAGGGKVYQHFEDIPKGKYKQCKLIAPHPCVTAKFVQCLAVDIPAVSHEWIIECCHKLTVLEVKPYLLPSGWSILENRYIKWAVGRGSEQRACTNPFFNSNVLLASQNKEFTEFWSRVCKFAGATIRFIKSESDITSNLTGYMLTDQEFPDDIKLEAQRKGIPVVSSVWAVQSLILGKICQPTAHEKLTQIYQDDDF